jgi:hypothetical protein
MGVLIQDGPKRGTPLALHHAYSIKIMNVAYTIIQALLRMVNHQDQEVLEDKMWQKAM